MKEEKTWLRYADTIEFTTKVRRAGWDTPASRGHTRGPHERGPGAAGLLGHDVLYLARDKKNRRTLQKRRAEDDVRKKKYEKEQQIEFQFAFFLGSSS